MILFRIELEFTKKLLPILNQASVVQKLDSTTHPINLYPVDSTIGFPNTNPLDSAIQRLNNGARILIACVAGAHKKWGKWYDRKSPRSAGNDNETTTTTTIYIGNYNFFIQISTVDG